MCKEVNYRYNCVPGVRFLPPCRFANRLKTVNLSRRRFPRHRGAGFLFRYCLLA